MNRSSPKSEIFANSAIPRKNHKKTFGPRFMVQFPKWTSKSRKFIIFLQKKNFEKKIFLGKSDFFQIAVTFFLGTSRVQSFFC